MKFMSNLIVSYRNITGTMIILGKYQILVIMKRTFAVTLISPSKNLWYEM